MRRPARPGPGLRRPQTVLPAYEQQATGMRSVESIWLALLDEADIVSEGRVEDGVYLGSTSILLPTTPQGSIPEAQVSLLVRAALVDPHFRLHAVRLARTEAFWRSGGQLDTLHVELAVRGDARGVHVDADVYARVVPVRQAAGR